MSSAAFFNAIEQTWNVLSRTKGFPSNSAKSRNLPEPNSRQSVNDGKKRRYEGKTLYLIYSGLGVTLPLAICYLIGTISTLIEPWKIGVALVLSFTTSCISGFCYAELSIQQRNTSGNISSAIYQLVGEFPAYIISYSLLVVSIGTTALFSKILSSTIDELSRQRLSHFLNSNLGSIWLNGHPPDIFASSAAIISAILLACGLKSATFLRGSMNILSCVIFVVFLVLSCSTYLDDNLIDDITIPRLKHPDNFEDIVCISGIFCFLFIQHFEICRQSKRLCKEKYRRILAKTITLSECGILAVSIGLTLALIAMNDIRLKSSGAPILEALQHQSLTWARLFLGLMQVIAVCFSLSESGSISCGHLVNMANNGFLPQKIASENGVTFSHSISHLIGGLLAALMAVLLDHLYLMQVISVYLLFVNVVVILVHLYRPHRCTLRSICSIAVTNSSSQQKVSNETKYVRNSAIKEVDDEDQNSVAFLKEGIAAWSAKYQKMCTNGNESSTPLLASVSHQQNESSSSQNNLVNIVQHLCIDAEVNHLGEEKDNSSDSDVDEAVAEYKKQLKTKFRGTDADFRYKPSPTPSTARKSFIAILSIFITFILCFTAISCESLTNYRIPLIVSVCGATLVIVIFAVFLYKLPVVISRKSFFNKFMSPWLPLLALGSNISMTILLVKNTRWAIVTLSLTGLLWYCVYVIRNSAAATRAKKKISKRQLTEVKTNEPIFVTSNLLAQSSMLSDFNGRDKKFGNIQQLA